MAGWGGIMPLIAGGLTDKGKVQPESRVLVFKLGAKGELPPPRKAPVLPPQVPALTASADEIAQGRTLFNGMCGACHGLNAASGGVIPDLRYLSPDKHQAFVGIVSGAFMSKGMPSFAGVLDMPQMQLIQQYIIKRSLDLRAAADATAAQ